MLSLRLQTIANMIPNSAKRVIDVGCDHALLDVSLALRHPDMQFLAIDVNESALASAIKNVKSHNLNERIQTKLNDGLKKIKIKKDDYVVISGMGTNTITDILDEKINKINNIIIQSNRDLERLRFYMFYYNFKAVEEKIVYDKKYYVIIYFKRIKFAKIKFLKRKFIPKKEDYWLGPLVKTSGNTKYFKYVLKYHEELLDTLPAYASKATETEERIKYLKELIEKK